MSDEKTGGFWNSYQRVMTYKAHFRLLILHPFLALVMWLLPYITYGVNPLEQHPYVFFTTIMVMILVLEGVAFVTRKYDLIILNNNKEIPKPFVRTLQYLLMGIMMMAIAVYVTSMLGILTDGQPIFGVKPIIFWSIYHIICFIVFTSMYALYGERRIKKRKLNTQLS